ncbi:MAG: DUF4296 domain-containing protein [Ferruginibacter sp.]
MIRVFMLLFGLGSLISCGNNDKKPSGILEPAKMQAVLWDIIRADVFTAQFIKTDSAKNDVAENLKLQQQIFAIHKISKADFYKSYDYYQSNTTQFKVLLDSMIAVTERNKNLNIAPILKAE